MQIDESLEATVSAGVARTGADLVAFLRASPLISVELDVVRDRSEGRAADLDEP